MDNTQFLFDAIILESVSLKIYAYLSVVVKAGRIFSFLHSAWLKRRLRTTLEICFSSAIISCDELKLEIYDIGGLLVLMSDRFIDISGQS